MLTMHFLQMKTDINNSATIEVFDGIGETEKLLAKVRVKNDTLPQSVTTSRQNLYVKFIAEPRTNTIVFVRLSSSYSKSLMNLRISLNLLKYKLKKLIHLLISGNCIKNTISFLL